MSHSHPLKLRTALKKDTSSRYIWWKDRGMNYKSPHRLWWTGLDAWTLLEECAQTAVGGFSVCHLPGTNYATPLSLSLSSLRVGGLSALCWCVRAKCSPTRGMASVWGPTQLRSFRYAAQVHRKVHKSLTLCVEVKASSYTILIASDLRNVPNVLVGLFWKDLNNQRQVSGQFLKTQYEMLHDRLSSCQQRIADAYNLTWNGIQVFD